MTQMKKRSLSLLLVLALALALMVPAMADNAPAVVPTLQSLTIDGEAAQPAAYNVDGYNYFKIRDIAALLNGTSGEFSVEYDEAANAIMIETDEAYEAVGGELEAVSMPSSIVPSPQKLFVNGEEVSVEAYNVDGYNYFKLRDLGAALDFGVAYDEESNTMCINLSTIVILHTNDVHTHISSIETDEESGEVSGTSYAALAAYKAEMEAAYGKDNVILVDAGDFSQGGPLGTLSKGTYLIQIMNALGYDAVTLGNHEFDYGMEQMQANMAMLDATVISCNFIDLATGEAYFDGYTCFDFNGVKVALVGMTTPEAFTKSSPTYFQDGEGNYIYGLCEDTVATTIYGQAADTQALYLKVQETIDAAKADGADFVIGLGHLGVDLQSSPWMSSEVIANTVGFDAFIDGHSHTTMSETMKDAEGNDVVVAQTGTAFENFGKVMIAPDGTVTSELIANYVTEDEAAAAAVAEIEAANAELLATVVATTTVELTVKDPATGERAVRSAETNMGDLCADAYRILLGADVAFVNGGGVRADIPVGDITYEQIISVHPFGNEACLVGVTGQQIADALELGSHLVGVAENGGFLQVSGLKYTIDPSVEDSVVLTDKNEFVEVAGERRVKDIMILDAATGEYAPIDLAKTYKLASHNYMLKIAGDGYAMFGTDNVNMLLDSVMIDNQVLINYIVDELGGVVGEAYGNPYGDGRITIEAPAEAVVAPAA